MAQVKLPLPTKHLVFNPRTSPNQSFFPFLVSLPFVVAVLFAASPTTEGTKSARISVPIYVLMLVGFCFAVSES